MLTPRANDRANHQGEPLWLPSMCNMVTVGLSARVSATIHGNPSLQTTFNAVQQLLWSPGSTHRMWRVNRVNATPVQGINYSLSLLHILGIKGPHLCAGACAKNVPVNWVWNVRKTKVDFHPTKVHFRQLHQKYPTRHRTDFFIILLQWNEIVPEMMKWCFTTL